MDPSSCRDRALFPLGCRVAGSQWLGPNVHGLPNERGPDGVSVIPHAPKGVRLLQGQMLGHNCDRLSRVVPVILPSLLDVQVPLFVVEQ